MAVVHLNDQLLEFVKEAKPDKTAAKGMPAVVHNRNVQNLKKGLTTAQAAPNNQSASSGILEQSKLA